MPKKEVRYKTSKLKYDFESRKVPNKKSSSHDTKQFLLPVNLP